MKTVLSMILTAAAVATIIAFIAAMAGVAGRYMERFKYRTLTNPRNIEKNAQDLLELELQQFLLEEEIKERARNRMEHPSNYSKAVGGGLDGETKEILAKLSDPRAAQRKAQLRQEAESSKFLPRRGRDDRNKDYWGGE